MSQEYQHPAFKAVPDSTVLWRYMDDYKFVHLLQEARMWMTRIPDLSDTYEGTIPIGETEWWNRKAQEAGSENERLTYIHNRDFMSGFVCAARENWFVSCWTIRDVEYPRMWKEYTKSPSSVAVRSSYGRLRAALPSFVEMGRVGYIDYGAERIEDETSELNIYHRVMHKHRPDFEWEREMRVFANINGPSEAPWVQEARACHFAKSDNPNIRVLLPCVDLSQLIEAVVLHPLSTKEYRQQVSEMCLGASLPAPISSELTSIDE